MGKRVRTTGLLNKAINKDNGHHDKRQAQKKFRNARGINPGGRMVVFDEAPQKMTPEMIEKFAKLPHGFISLMAEAPVDEGLRESLKNCKPGNIIPYRKGSMPQILYYGKSYDEFREDFREQEGI